MATPLCHHAMSNNRNNSSAFVPIIGLYIAGASMVCLLLMIWDIVHGVRRSRSWLPCRRFTLNALTLTLLSTAAKLTADINTPMPSAWDQLSKLTGTAFICVSMGFLLPSLGTYSASESYTNMAALSVFVVTVIINVWKQIFTGVIFSFIPEHTIITFFMLAMICLLWLSAWGINMKNETQMDLNKDLFTDGKGSTAMLQRLKVCYMHGYSSAPQVLLSRYFLSIFTDIVCLFCSIVVLQVLFRIHSSHDLRYCNEVSNYGWSVWIIAATQIIFILLASLCTGYRAFILIDQIDYDFYWDHVTTDGLTGKELYLQLSLYDDNGLKTECIQFLVIVGSIIAFLILIFPVGVVALIYIFVRHMQKNAPPPKGIEEEYTELLRENDLKIENYWTLTRCVDDIKRWISSAVENKNSLSNLEGLFRKWLPSGCSLEELYKKYDLKEGKEVSSLHLVVLQRIAFVLQKIPLVSFPSLGDHLGNSLREIFDIIHEVDTKINSSSSRGRKNCRLAKAMWNGDFSSVVSNIEEKLAAQSDQANAVRIISELETVLKEEFIQKEVGFVMNFIDPSNRTTHEELSECMEQLFVVMVHMFLMRIPNVIYKEITESPPEKYFDNVRNGVKLICQVKSLEGIVKWSFPDGCNITSLTLQHEDDKHNVVNKV